MKNQQRVTVEIVTFVLDFFGGDCDKFKLWLETKNPLLGISPAEMINAGRGEKLLAFIKQQLAENEAPPPLL